MEAFDAKLGSLSSQLEEKKGEDEAILAQMEEGTQEYNQKVEQIQL